MKKKLLMVLLISTMILASGTVARAEDMPEMNTEETLEGNTEDLMDTPENKEDILPILHSGDIAISEDVFPDDRFRKYLESAFDKDGDGYFSPDEIDSVTSIDVNGMSTIKSLEGIQHFTNLEDLACNMIAGLRSLDVSRNPNLKILNCSNSKIASLDVSKNTKLQTLNCENSKLTALDISRNPDLQILNCCVNGLTVLDVSKNLNLQTLQCRGNQLTALDISQNPNLQTLGCGSNQIAALDVSKNPKLQILECGGNQLTALDVSKNPDLQRLECNGNQIEVLDVSNNPNLSLIWCINNQLKNLDVSNKSELISLMCENNQIKELNITNNPKLSTLGCKGNQLTSLDISNNSNLEALDCSDNHLSRLVLGENSKLRILWCINNKLSSLDVSKSKGLGSLRCYNNNLKNFDLSNNGSMPIGTGDYENPNILHGSLLGAYVAPQSITANIVSTNGKWTLDLGAIVGKENLGRIILATNGAALSADGIVTFSDSNMPTELVYNYDTKNPAEDTPMTVNVALTAKNIDDQTGNDITVDTGDLDLDSIYKNYNLNLNTNIEIILSQDNPSKDDLDKLTQAAGANGYSIAAAYEILMTLYSDGQKVTDITDNFGRIKLTFKVDTSLAGQSAVVYQLHNNSQIIVHDGLTVNTDGTVTITVDKFSAFAVSVKKSSDATSKPDTSKPDTSKPDTNKPETGKDDTNKTEKQPETNQDGTDQSNAGKTDATMSNVNQNAPKTGDGVNLVFWMVVAIAASMTGILTIKRYHRN